VPTPFQLSAAGPSPGSVAGGPGLRSASEAAEGVVAAGERRAPHPTAECAHFPRRGVLSGTAHSLLFALSG